MTINMIDDEADVTHDDQEEDTQDEEEEESKDEGSPGKRRKTHAAKEPPQDHCDINFVKDTPYFLLASSSQKQWGSCTSVDPAPAVPTSREDTCSPGDYLLIAGKDITLKKTGTNFTTTTFDPEDELILTNNWERFDMDMTGQDLVDLEDVTFLLWWQNVKPPPSPKPKAPAITKKKAVKKKK
jgi:hypothetical protein